MKTSIRETDMALVGVAAFAALDSKDNGVCRDIHIVLGAVGSTPMRAKRAEELVRGQKVDDRIVEKAAQVASEDSQPISDIHASEAYKREMVKVFVKRSVLEAISRAKMA